MLPPLQLGSKAPHFPILASIFLPLRRGGFADAIVDEHADAATRTKTEAVVGHARNQGGGGTLKCDITPTGRDTGAVGRETLCHAIISPRRRPSNLRAGGQVG